MQEDLARHPEPVMLMPKPNVFDVVAPECGLAKATRHRVEIEAESCRVALFHSSDAQQSHLRIARHPGYFLVVVPLDSEGISDAWHDRCPAPIPSALRTALHVFDLRYDWSIATSTSFHALAVEVPCRVLTGSEIGDGAAVSSARREGAQNILANLCTATARLIEFDAKTHDWIIRHLIDAVISNIQFGLCEYQLHPRPSKDRLAAWQEQRIRTYIAANLTEKIKVSDVSRSCGISSSHFSRLFKNTIGITLHQWVIEQRIEEAKRLLAETSAAISEIAFATGFADQAHFSRVFSRTTHATPMVWRRHKRA